MTQARKLGTEDFVLAALAIEPDAQYKPVQVQKMFFLLDRRLPRDVIGGPYFDFQPYDYGPFDKRVYDVLELLAEQGLVKIIETDGWRRRLYALTAQGQARGQEVLEKLNDIVRRYMSKVASYVRSMTFAQLVAAVYRDYPEMRKNSVFQKYA